MFMVFNKSLIKKKLKRNIIFYTDFLYWTGKGFLLFLFFFFCGYIVGCVLLSYLRRRSMAEMLDWAFILEINVMLFRSH